IFQLMDDMNDIEVNRSKYASIFETLISGLIYFMLGILVLKKGITIGNVCLYAGCVSMFLEHFRYWILQITLLADNTKYVKMYFDFLDIQNKKYEGSLPVEKRDDDQFTIEFRNVSFRYPGSNVDVLKNFSIQFKIGERLAVVGKNGSGKTTFIKLLCRLYDPTEGEILLNGIDIRKYDYAEYLSLFSVVFQDFKIPAFSIGQNVAAAMEYDEERVTAALKKVGLTERLKHLPQDLDTPLYKDFDQEGVDISGGEAQKIAIARALYHDTPFVILDEPTAALDPLAEYEIYSHFDELVGTKTAVYISHRLSSCQFCNDILVIDGGKAVQRGNHDALVKDHEGLYYTLWNTQAQYYQEA
ncbi:MAG: ABC transporter ATP-binding protein, partial [Eubacteriales bacterium]|nr:ABC transporter ATP-binding protein [Eubacteriales bacterium]